MTIKDQEIWEKYTRGMQTARARKPKVASVKKTEDKKTSHIVAFLKPQLHSHRTENTKAKMSPVTLERKREKSLRQGDIAIEARLDLHGMTQETAFAALADFMSRNTRAGKRNLLIITGKGRGGDGVLRRNLENWLRHLPEAKSILALRPAAPQHGGAGAFYVILRKTPSRG